MLALSYVNVTVFLVAAHVDGTPLINEIGHYLLLGVPSTFPSQLQQHVSFIPPAINDIDKVQLMGAAFLEATPEFPIS